MEMAGALTAMSETIHEVVMATLAARLSRLCAAAFASPNAISFCDGVTAASASAVGACVAGVSLALAKASRPHVVEAGSVATVISSPCAKLVSLAAIRGETVTACEPFALHPSLFLQGLRPDQETAKDGF